MSDIYLGLYHGIVVSTDAPFGYVKVTVAQVNNGEVALATVVFPVTGQNEHALEAGSEVVVGYWLGDPQKPHVLGSYIPLP